jgi:glucokinase
MTTTPVTIGIDLGATKTLILACTGQNEITYRLKIPTRTTDGQAAILEQIVSHTQQVISELADRNVKVVAVGLGFPGLVNYYSGLTYSSVMLPDWKEMNLKQYFSQELDLHAIVDNDVNTAIYAEWKYGAGAGYRDIICLAVGTGIGGGIIINNSLYRGSDGTAGEFGNSTIDYRGPEFRGGNSGALNALASGQALEEKARDLIRRNEADPILLSVINNDPESVTVETLADAASVGSPAAKAILQQGAELLGVGIANFVNIFNPQLVLIGGGVVQIGDWYLERVKEEVHKRAFDIPARRAQILQVALGQDAGAIGAAALAFDSLNSSNTD